MRISDWSSDVCSSDLVVDHVSLGTGFRIDLAGSPLLAPVADRIATWRRLVSPPPSQSTHEFLDFPDLGPGFELQPLEPGVLDWVGRIHAFTFAAALSHGNVSGDIPAVSDGANRLADAIARSEEHTSELQSLIRTSYAVFCLKKQKKP